MSKSMPEVTVEWRREGRTQTAFSFSCSKTTAPSVFSYRSIAAAIQNGLRYAGAPRRGLHPAHLPRHPAGPALRCACHGQHYVPGHVTIKDHRGRSSCPGGLCPYPTLFPHCGSRYGSNNSAQYSFQFHKQKAPGNISFQVLLELLSRLELETSSLPRMRSTA